MNELIDSLIAFSRKKYETTEILKKIVVFEKFLIMNMIFCDRNEKKVVDSVDVALHDFPYLSQ